jgi:hypothetical protein
VIAREVERLDELAWNVQDDPTAQAGDYEAAFQRARALNSYLLAHYERQPGDALYEALHALGGDGNAEEFVER